MANKLNENSIREAAYYLWQNAGCPQGNDEYFWSQAVEQLSPKSSTKKSSSKVSASSTSSAKSLLKNLSNFLRRFGFITQKTLLYQQSFFVVAEGWKRHNLR